VKLAAVSAPVEIEARTAGEPADLTLSPPRFGSLVLEFDSETRLDGLRVDAWCVLSPGEPSRARAIDASPTGRADRLEFEELPAARYSLRVTRGRESLFAGGFEIRDGERTTIGPLRLAPEPAPKRTRRVVDEAGLPVAGARVQAGSILDPRGPMVLPPLGGEAPEARSDADGFFALDAADDFWISKDGFATRRCIAEETGDTIELRAGGSVRVVGIPADAWTGRSWSFHLTRTDAPPIDGDGEGSHDEKFEYQAPVLSSAVPPRSESFELKGLLPGVYELVVFDVMRFGASLDPPEPQPGAAYRFEVEVLEGETTVADFGARW